MPTFPFGRSARGSARLGTSPRPLFVLGAYPSAVHIRWVPPVPWKPIAAVAVDLEPEPFWNGGDEATRVDAWRIAVKWQSAWGRALPAGGLNGSSGGWVDGRVLAPLAATRVDAWITDALDCYWLSAGAAARIADTYTPFAASRDDLPTVELPQHPDENAIVRGAIATELPRFREEFAAARPETVVTLGNAALRVLTALTEPGASRPPPRKLRDDSSYGAELLGSIGGHRFRWLPLAHPAAPQSYQAAHDRWMASRR